MREAVGADFDGPRFDAAPRSAGSAAAASSSDDILRVPLRGDLVIQRAPQKALDVLAQITAGAPPPGYKGNAAFANDGRGGGEVLPAADGSGNAITYKEWDVEPFQKGSMVYEVAGIMNVGGTEVRLPKALTYRDGI